MRRHVFFPPPQDIRKSISANVHVKAILCKLMQGASELAGGAGEEDGPPSRSIHLHTVEATHKVIQKLEVTVKVSRTSRISSACCLVDGCVGRCGAGRGRVGGQQQQQQQQQPQPPQLHKTNS